MLNFEALKKRRSKATVVEKYAFPVLTIHPKLKSDTKQRNIQKFELNKAAVEALTISDQNYIGIAYDEVGEGQKLVLVNFTTDSKWKVARLNKDFTFNSLRLFDMFQKELNFDESVMNEFRISTHIDEATNLQFIDIDSHIIELKDTPAELSDEDYASEMTRIEYPTLVQEDTNVEHQRLSTEEVADFEYAEEV